MYTYISTHTQELRTQLKLTEPVDIAHWRPSALDGGRGGVGEGAKPAVTAGWEWQLLGKEIADIPEGAEVVYLYAYIYIYVYVYVDIYKYVSVHMCVCIHINIRMYIYVYKYIHFCICT